ncbi:hypothetical protein [Vibrio phage RYC]|nr:hypothetical protein [Vibrio phage RYC]
MTTNTKTPLTLTEIVTHNHKLTNLLEELEKSSRGYDIYLGGGYLRDEFCNENRFSLDEKLRKPKDIDIFLVPRPEEFLAFPVVRLSLISFDTNTTKLAKVRPNIQRIVGIDDHAVVPRSVQLIEYKEYMTMEEVAEDMDCNINQVMYSHKEQRAYATPEFYKGHTFKQIEMMAEFEESRMIERILRMKRKFPEYEMINDITVTAEPVPTSSDLDYDPSERDDDCEAGCGGLGLINLGVSAVATEDPIKKHKRGKVGISMCQMDDLD